MTHRFFSTYKGALSLFVFAHFAHHLITALPVPLLPMIRNEFNLDYAQSGLLISAFSVSYGIAQLPTGWLADRIGKRAAITIGILGVAFCGLMIGLSHSLGMMAAFLILMGLAGGCYHPAATPAVSQAVDPEKRGRALGIHVIGGSASYFVAPLVAVATAAALGWRGSFITLAIPAILFGILFYIAMGHLPERASGKTDSTAAETAAGKRHRTYSLVIVIVLSTFASATLNAVISFMPLFMVDHIGISAEAGGAFLSIVYFAGLWASILGGYLSDRFGSLRVLIAVCLSTGLLIYSLNLASSELTIGVLLFLIGTILYIRMPIAESYIMNNTSERHRSTVFGIYFFSAMEGNGVINPLFGYMADHIGFNNSFTIAAASVIAVTIVCAALLAGGRTINRQA